MLLMATLIPGYFTDSSMIDPTSLISSRELSLNNVTFLFGITRSTLKTENDDCVEIFI